MLAHSISDLPGTLSSLHADLRQAPVRISRQQLVERLTRGLIQAPDDLATGAAIVALAQSLPDPMGITLTESTQKQIWNEFKRRPDKTMALKGLLLIFLANAAGSGFERAFIQLALGNVLVQDWNDSAVDLVATLLEDAGLYDFITEATLELIGADLSRRAPTHAVARVQRVLRLCGLSERAPHDRREAAFRLVFVPVYRGLCEADLANEAISVEHYAYGAHIKRTETAENHTACWSAMAPPARALGERMRRRLGEPEFRARPGQKPKVAFFVPNAVMLAHTGLLLAYLRGWHRLKDKPIEPVVYALGGPDPSPLRSEVEKLGVAYIHGASLTGERDVFSLLAAARKRFFEAGIAQVVFVSLPTMMAFCHGFRLAPAVTWWGMKFPLPTFGFLEMRLQCLALYKKRARLFDQDWCFSLQPQEPLEIAPRARIDAVRAKYAGRFILGTIAREEKINTPQYIEAVTRILQANPNACFIWTGRKQLAEIDQAFSRAGVAERCHFVGWVEPEVYCSVFDLFLDTFPLSGIMPNQAMHAGVAVVTGNTNGAFNYFTDVPDGEPPYTTAQKAELDAMFGTLPQRLGKLAAETVDEYVALACRLIADDSLRAEFADAGKTYVDTIRFNIEAAARDMSSHFADISNTAMGEAAPRPQPSFKEASL
jgi:glycosyltransferase involved in cell wall biosynthesis